MRRASGGAAGHCMQAGDWPQGTVCRSGMGHGARYAGQGWAAGHSLQTRDGPRGTVCRPGMGRGAGQGWTAGHGPMDVWGVGSTMRGWISVGWNNSGGTVPRSRKPTSPSTWARAARGWMRSSSHGPGSKGPGRETWQMDCIVIAPAWPRPWGARWASLPVKRHIVDLPHRPDLFIPGSLVPSARGTPRPRDT